MAGMFYARNKEIHEARENIPLWILAEKLDCHENTLRNWLKRDLPPKKKMKILAAIEEIKQLDDTEND